MTTPTKLDPIALAEAIAPALDASVDYERSRALGRAELTRAGGWRIVIGGGGARWVIYGTDWDIPQPDIPTTFFKYPTITVATSKSPAQIAREIKRRLLPTYETLLGHALAQSERIREGNVIEEALADEAAAILGSLGSRHRDDAGKPSVRLWTVHYYGDVKPSSYRDGTYSMDLHDLPADLSQALLRTIADYARENPC